MQTTYETFSNLRFVTYCPAQLARNAFRGGGSTCGRRCSNICYKFWTWEQHDRTAPRWFEHVRVMS